MPESSRSSESVLSDPQDALSLFSQAGRFVLIVMVAGWVAWFAPFDDLVDRSGTPLGGDYVMLYVAGQAVAAGETDSLYDDQLNQLRTAAAFPTMEPTESWPYRYPPITAWLMQGPARLPFSVSFAVFLTTCMACVVFALRYLVRRYIANENNRSAVFWGLLGCPLVCEAVAGGQSSPIALALVTAGIAAMRSGRDLTAGVLIGLCIYKPNIVGLVVIGVLVARPKAFFGMLAVAAAAIVISLQGCGAESIRQYVDLALSLTTSSWQLETPYWKVHGLAPYFDLVVAGKGKALAFLCGIPLAAWLGLQLRRNDDRHGLIFGSLLIANALFNPYVPIYDMLLLLPAFAAAGPWFASRLKSEKQPVPILLVGLAAIAYAGPHLSQALAKPLGVQLFPLLLLGVLVVQIREICACGTRAGCAVSEETSDAARTIERAASA